MEEKLIKLRQEAGYSQEEVASCLNLTRQSYIATEKGTRKPTSEDLENLAEFYGIPVEEFFFVRSDTNKFEQMYFYILSHFPANGIPKTKLAKLIYLADFYHYYSDLEPMSGIMYRRKQYGPLADVFLSLTDELYDSGKIAIDHLEYAEMIKPVKQKTVSEKNLIFVTSANHEYDLLSVHEKEQIDKICDYWHNRRTAEIVNFTHEQKPWMSCRDGEIIPYELILQEDPDHVYAPLA